MNSEIEEFEYVYSRILELEQDDLSDSGVRNKLVARILQLMEIRSKLEERDRLWLDNLDLRLRVASLN